MTARSMLTAAVAIALVFMSIAGGTAVEAKDTDMLNKEKSQPLQTSQFLFNLAQAEHSIVSKQLADGATGYTWMARDSAIGPNLCLGASAFCGSSEKSGFTSVTHRKAKDSQGATEWFTEWSRPDGLQMSWTARRLPDLSVVEFQSQLKNSGSAPLSGLTEYGPLVFRLSSNPESLRFHFVSRQSYRKFETPFVENLSVDGGVWYTPANAGWVAIEDREKKEILFIGIEWERDWRIAFEREGEGLRATVTLHRFTHTLAAGETVDAPRAFVGVSHGGVGDSLLVLHDYLRQYVMPTPPKDFPYVAYDLWGTEAEGVEQAISGEIAFAKALGVDLFYIDASWYEGSCKNGSGDWFTGVGNWQAGDRVKYPRGLADLSKRVHAAGMKFGLWFAPQVCDSKLVGGVVARGFIAQRGGLDITHNTGNGWAPLTQICTGNPKAVDYLKAAMAGAVRRYDLDWIKWDNSGLLPPICDRPDHGHEASDGALAALRGQYEVWRYLHEQFPALSIEQCGYSSRLDYGLARTFRAGWLSDATQSALTVRQNQLHASYILPAACNEAWVARCNEIEQTKDPAILDCIIRSRMLGMFGAGTLFGKLSELVSRYPVKVQDALRRNIADYKTFRHLLLEDVYHTLPPSTTADAWDAVQFCKRDASEAVLMAFRSGSPDAGRQFTLRGLDPEGVYTVTSCNTRRVTQVKGADLASTGLAIALPNTNTSEVYLLKRETK